jgi:hypothetical protein
MRRTRVNRRHARILAAGPAAVLAATLGVTAALAATTWTVKPGGAFTATAGNASFKDTTTRATFTCTSVTASGTLKSGSGLSGSGAGSISAVVFGHCTSPLGVTWGLKPTDLPWHVNLSSYNGGVATGSISHMQIQFAGPSCTAVIDGTSATASNGHLKFRYTDGTGRLQLLATGGDLHFYNVNGCAGIYDSGDVLTASSATFALSPKQAITSP